MDAVVVIGALAGVITTLSGAVALLYRAQIQVLNDRIADKNQQLERWQKVAEQNGAAMQESVTLNRQMKETVDRIFDELLVGRGSGGKTR